MDYLAARVGGAGRLPTQDTLVLERFFDEAGGMQLVIHAPFGAASTAPGGSRCANASAATSTSSCRRRRPRTPSSFRSATTHSFELADVAQYLHANNRARRADPGGARCADVRDPLALDGRDRAGGAAIPRRQEGAAAAAAHGGRGPDRRGVPRPARLPGEHRRDREIPDHPLVQPDHCTIACTRRWTSTGWSALLRGIEAGDVRVVTRDLTQPSPLALEVLSARPYAFLDDAPLEERRTQAVMARRWLAPETAADLGRLDAEAIARVRAEAWPESGQRRRAARCAVVAWLPDCR